MQQEDWISQVADHLSREPGAVRVVIGQQPKGGVQPPAVLTRLDQREVESRQPMATALHAIGQRGAAGNLIEQLTNRLAIRAVGGMAFEFLQRADQAQPGARELAELMIKISAPRKLPRRKDHLGPQTATRSRLAFRSRLLRSPTIWSATWPW